MGGGPRAAAAFLGSKRCVCGPELLRFRDAMARTFDTAVPGLVGAALLALALVLLWGAVVAHAARVWQLRCGSNGCGYAARADDWHVAKAGPSAGGADLEDGLPRHATVLRLAERTPAPLPAAAAVPTAPPTAPPPAEAAHGGALRARGGSYSGGSGFGAMRPPQPAAAPVRLAPPPAAAAARHARTHSM